jgi:hypothetical protein
MKCRYTFDDINEYADGALSEERTVEIKTHIEACKACRQYYNSIMVSEKYMKENISLKSDIRMKVLESIDVERYKNKNIFYRLGLIRNKTGLIKNFAIAAACVFLSVLVLRNEYTGGFITSEISKILEQKQQNYTVPSATNKGFDSPVEKGEALLYEMGSEYHLVYPDGHERKINLPGNIYSHQAFVSEDLSSIYYNTNFIDVLGRIMRYDIDSGKSYDLLAEMGIELDGHIAVFSYDKDRLVAIIGSTMKDTDGNDTKIETNRLLEIDLKEKTHKFVELPFTPWNAAMGKGIDFFGDDYLISYMDIVQKTFVVDKKGLIVREIPLSDPSFAVNMQVSPDNSMILYQVGQTPTDLYLYDIKKEMKITILDSTKDNNINGKHSYCTFSAWSKFPENVYYVSMNDSNEEGKSEYNLQKYVVNKAAFDEAFDKIKAEKSNSKDLELLQMMFPNYEFIKTDDEIKTYNYDSYLDFGVVPDNGIGSEQKSELPFRYYIDRIEKGIFIEGIGEKSLIIARRDGVAHADGFYHAYVAVFDEQQMKLLSPVKHFMADEGKVSIFKGKNTPYVLFAGSTTYQGHSDFSGGLWKFDKEWKQVWPEEEDFWNNNSILVGEDSISVLKMKKVTDPHSLTDFELEFSHKLIWNAEKEVFEKQNN